MKNAKGKAGEGLEISGRIRAYIQDDPMGGVAVYLVRDIEPGKVACYADGGAVNKIVDEGASFADLRPFLQIRRTNDRETLAVLKKAISDYLGEPGPDNLAGRLQATERHLSDLRLLIPGLRSHK